MSFNWIKPALHATGKFLMDKAPIILTTLGVGGMVGAGVIACKETRWKLDETLDVTRSIIENGKKDLDPSSPNYRLQIAHIYAKGISKVGLLYAPAVAVGLLSASAIFGSALIFETRLAAALEACTAAEFFGHKMKEKLEKNLEDDIATEENKPESEQNKELIKEKSEELFKVRQSVPRSICVIYDEMFNTWSDDYPRQNFEFVMKTIEKSENILRERAKGHNPGFISWAEVLGLLGCPENYIKDYFFHYGWVFYWDENDIPDNVAYHYGKIDLGLFDFIGLKDYNDEMRQKRAFVEGDEPSAYLCPKTDGYF